MFSAVNSLRDSHTIRYDTIRYDRRLLKPYSCNASSHTIIHTAEPAVTSRIGPNGQKRTFVLVSDVVDQASVPAAATRSHPTYIHTYSFITQNDRKHLHNVKIQVKIRIKACQ